jgi:hypothetical protein
MWMEGGQDLEWVMMLEGKLAKVLEEGLKSGLVMVLVVELAQVLALELVVVTEVALALEWEMVWTGM